MIFKLFLLFFTVPLVELALLIKIGQMIGVLNTVLVVVVTAALGALLARSEGLAVLFELKRKISRGHPPGDSLLDGLLVLIGGLVLLTPGLLTDFFGFILLIPFTRTRIREWLKNKLRRMIDRNKLKYWR